jgi:hypothetical protein
MSPMRQLRDTAPRGRQVCFECAKPVSAQGSASRFVSLGAYTPKHLAERIQSIPKLSPFDIGGCRSGGGS